MSMMDMIEDQHFDEMRIERRAHELSVEEFAKTVKFPEPHRREDYEAIFIQSILNSSRERAKQEIEAELEAEQEHS